MFEAAVDSFCGAIAGLGVVEVGQDVPSSAFERSSKCDDLHEGVRDARVAKTGYFGLYQGLTHTRVGRPVGIDNVLVDAPGDL